MYFGAIKENVFCFDTFDLWRSRLKGANTDGVLCSPPYVHPLRRFQPAFSGPSSFMPLIFQNRRHKMLLRSLIISGVASLAAKPNIVRTCPYFFTACFKTSAFIFGQLFVVVDDLGW